MPIQIDRKRIARFCQERGIRKLSLFGSVLRDDFDPWQSDVDVLAEFVKERYASWDSGIGAKIESGKSNLTELEAYMLKKGEVTGNVSGRQEFLENLINEFI